MRFIERMKALGFAVNWHTIFIGWHPDGPVRQLSYREVLTYAFDKLEGSTGDERDRITDLYVARPLEFGCMHEALAGLAALEKTDAAPELVKWQVVLLEDTVAHLARRGTVDDIVELYDFWSAFHMPDHTPRDLFEKPGDVLSREYYSQENLNRILRSQEQWMAASIAELRVKDT